MEPPALMRFGMRSPHNRVSTQLVAYLSVKDEIIRH
jgi:hypothetical protein